MNFRSIGYVAIASIISCGSASLAQAPSSGAEPGDAIIRSTTRLVQVSVIAKSHDQPAEGLKADDFKILVDGHAQKISFFSVESTGKVAQPAAPATPRAANSFTNVAQARGGTLNGITVVLLDLVNTKMTDRMYARQQMIKYLLSIPAEQHIGVYLFDGRLSVLHDYTADMTIFQQRLAESKDRLVNVSGSEQAGAIDLSGGSTPSDQSGIFMGGGSSQERGFYLRDRVLGTLNVLKFIASHFAELPGRKNLVWVSGGFPLTFGYEHMSKFSEDFFDEMDSAVRSLSNANIAVYPVDARGLVSPAMYDASKSGMSAAAPTSGRPGRGNAAARPPVPHASNGGTDIHATMDELAHRTGGHAYYNTNDLSKAIRDAADDSAYTYTLGFYPEDEKHNREFHKLKVEVDQPHINLNYRSGYLDMAEVSADDRTRSVQLHDALWSPLEATELGLNVNVSKPVSSGAVFTGGAAPVSPDALSVSVTLQPRGIQLKPQGDRYTGRVDVLMAQFDASGRPVDSPMETVALNMLAPTYQKFLKEGISVKETLNILPQTKSIRVIVRDFGSGMIGSVTVPMKDLSGVI